MAAPAHASSRAPANQPALAFAEVSHGYGRATVVDRFSLAVAPGEVVCLLGPSGCGKTTLLRLAAGLEQVQEGEVLFDGQVMGGGGIDIPPERRRVGLMFQDFALFPHLDLAANVAFGLHGPDARERALAWLDRVGLRARSGDYPHRLSGGEQQRVSLVRALASKPRVMLMDEPFSSLDTALRAELRIEALSLLRESGAATLLVTHDPDEAMAMTDRLAVMRAGRLVQAGPPRELYLDPIDSFVARFLGRANLLAARVEGGAARTVLGAAAAPGIAEGTEVLVMARPEALRLDAIGIAARVLDARHIGSLADIRLGLDDGTQLELCSLNPLLPQAGQEVRVAVDVAALRVLAR